MPDTKGADSRLTRLEEISYFQEEQLKSLEKHLLAQQKQIDSLERGLEQLKAALGHLRDIMEMQKSESYKSGIEESPPHYLPEKW